MIGPHIDKHARTISNLYKLSVSICIQKLQHTLIASTLPLHLQFWSNQKIIQLTQITFNPWVVAIIIITVICRTLFVHKFAFKPCKCPPNKHGELVCTLCAIKRRLFVCNHQLLFSVNNEWCATLSQATSIC